MMQCWKNNPTERPSFEVLRSMLHEMILDEEQVRIKEYTVDVTQHVIQTWQLTSPMTNSRLGRERDYLSKQKKTAIIMK